MTDLLDNPEAALTAFHADGPTATPTERSDHATSGSSLVDNPAASRGNTVLVPSTGRTVVLVPHPDDEALATGGLIAYQRVRGNEVVIVAITDGRADGHDRNSFGRGSARRREQLDALERLGVGRGSIHRLEIPGGEVPMYVEDVIACAADLLTPDDVIVAPALFDRDLDHGACGRAATAVAARVGCQLLGSVSPADRQSPFATHGLAFAALALTEDEVARRRAALACHRSRLCCAGLVATGRALPAEMERLLDRPFEYYVVEGRSGEPNCSVSEL